MPQLINQITGRDWEANGPQTRAQRFFKQYGDIVDSQGFNHGSGLQFYGKNAIFHNQNNAIYHGGVEMWAWMKQLFAQFERLKHEHLNIWEIQNDNGTVRIMSQVIRHIWMKGNNTDTQDVSIPLSWICLIGASDNTEAFDGLEYREVWLYWDTALLKPFLSDESVVFKTENILRGDGGA